MEQKLSKYKTQILTVTIVLIAIMGASLLSIWNNSAEPKPDQLATSQSEEATATNSSPSMYIISVYYYPERESDAQKLQSKLEDSGYIVNTSSGSDLNKERVITKSYLYYKQNDHEHMLVLRELLSDTLDEDFSVHISGDEKSDKTMRVVLVDKDK